MDSPQLKSSEDVEAALDSIGRAAPTLEFFRDGRLIDDHPCRLTIGRLALLEISEAKLFIAEPEEEIQPTEYDIFHGWWFTIEENLDESVLIADQKDLVRKAVRKLMDGYSRKERQGIIDQFRSWLTDISNCMPQLEQGGSGKTHRKDWWLDCIDILGFQYHWSESFLLWYLPLPRAIRYQESIASRISGEPIIDEISDDVINALDRIEEVMKHGESET